VVKNGRAALQPLEIGHASDRDAEILSGVAEGDQVILSPSDKIRDGVPVRLRRND
jgi:HlyD family secretion protein